MAQKITAAVFGALCAVTLNAAQIMIGSGPGGEYGLTSSYITSSTTSSCSGAALGQAGFTNCSAGASNPGGGGEKAYSSVLFDSASPSPAPTVGTTTTPATVTATLNGQSVNFAMIADSSGGTNNFWGTTGSGKNQITVPIGIYGIDSVNTMLNDYWGTTGGVGNLNGETTEVDFYFNASSSDGSTGTTIEDKITLSNGVEIRSSIDCLTASGSAVCPVQTTGATGSQTNGAIQTTLASSTVDGDATVYTDAGVYSAHYTSVSSSGTLFTNTTGTEVLDAQQFNFGTLYTSDWLTKIVINNTGQNLNYSRDALSAVTVDVYSPEPSTWLLLGCGLLAVGFAGRRLA